MDSMDFGALPAGYGEYAAYGASAEKKEARLLKRKTRLDARTWGIFRKRRQAKVDAKLSALQAQRQAAGLPLMDPSYAESLAAAQVAEEEGYAPPVDVEQQALMAQSTTATNWVPIAAGVGGLALLGAILYVATRKK